MVFLDQLTPHNLGNADGLSNGYNDGNLLLMIGSGSAVQLEMELERVDAPFMVGEAD